MPNTESRLIESPAAAYHRAVAALQPADVPFLVGGGHAIHAHTGLLRSTKDFGLFLAEADLPRAMDILSAAGFRTELTFSHWPATAHFEGGFIDLIFNSGNGCRPVDQRWFQHGVDPVLMGVKLTICPPEECTWQNAFIMER